MLKINKLMLSSLFVLAILAGTKLAHDYLDTPEWLTVALNTVFGSGDESANLASAQTGGASDGALAHAPDTGKSAAQNASIENAPNHPMIDDKKLAELMEKHISPEMRTEINEMLRPGDRPPETIRRGETEILDTSDRASTVVIGLIDESGELVVTDITSPLKEPAD